jgi:hypothetical protein
VAQFEKSVIVAKLRAARIRKRKATGRCEGRKPFGTKPGEAETLALIRRLRRKPRGGKRLSYDVIAARLNANGIPSSLHLGCATPKPKKRGCHSTSHCLLASFRVESGLGAQRQLRNQAGPRPRFGLDCQAATQEHCPFAHPR